MLPVRKADIPPSCAVVMTSGNLNLLETSGPLQACNGTALPLRNGLDSAVVCPKLSMLVQKFWHSASFCVKYWAAAVAYLGIFFGRRLTNSFEKRGQTFTFTFILYYERCNSCSVFFPPGCKLWWNVEFDPIPSVSFNVLSYYKIIHKIWWEFDALNV